MADGSIYQNKWNDATRERGEQCEEFIAGILKKHGLRVTQGPDEVFDALKSALIPMIHVFVTMHDWGSAYRK